MGDLHLSGCEGLVAFPGGSEASTPPFMGLPIPFALSGVLFLLRQAYKVLQSGYFFIFGDLISTPHFLFLCCRPESNTDRSNPACTTVGRRIYFQNIRAFIF